MWWWRAVVTTNITLTLSLSCYKWQNIAVTVNIKLIHALQEHPHMHSSLTHSKPCRHPQPGSWHTGLDIGTPPEPKQHLTSSSLLLAFPYAALSTSAEDLREGDVLRYCMHFKFIQT